jgi:hypothetical protein
MAEAKKEIELEIAHVLFVDIVGYSKLSINEQHMAVEELNQVVRASEQFQRAEAASRSLKIPTGDSTEFVGRGTTAGLSDKFRRVDFEVKYVFNLENHL